MNEQTKPQAGAQPLSAPMPTREENKPLAKVQTLGELFRNAEFKERIAQSVPRHVSEERMLRTFAMAAQNEGMRNVTLMSFIGACLTTSQLGLEVNNPLGHAYLIPFGVYEGYGDQRRLVRTDVQYIPGYKGLIELSYRSGKVVSMHPDVVWTADEENGRFEYHYGTGAKLVHRPLYVPRNPEAEDPLYAYCHADLVDGQAFLVWPWAEVMRIRNLSQGYQHALRQKTEYEAKGWRLPKAYTEAPWIKHRLAMGRKTMVRAISNLMPRSIELASVVHLDERQDRKPADFSKVIDADPIRDAEGRQTRDYLGAATRAAEEAEAQAEAEEREARQQEGRAGSAGATFTDRRAGAESKPAAPTTAKQQAPAPSEPTFSSDLIDAFGEILGTHEDARAFAQAFLALWQQASDDEQREALREYNADGLAFAREIPEASAVLDQMDAPPPSEETPVFTPVEPPLYRNGQPDWAGWLRLCKIEVGQAEPAHLPHWLEAHRDILPRAPSGPRLQLVRAVDSALAGTGLSLPSWLVDIMEGKPAAPSAESESGSPSRPREGSPTPQETPPHETPSQEAAESPPEPEPDPKDRDAIWARRTLARLKQFNDARGLKEEMTASAVQKKMQRMKTERPELWKAVSDAANRRMHDLSLAEQEPPPPEQGDPGPDGA